MADAWTTAPGQKPTKPDVASIIREAQNATEHAGDASMSEVGLDGTSLRHTDIDDAVGGGSSLSREQLGSAALSAALTLHPCVFLSGVGDASKQVLHAMLSQAGPCSVQLVLDEETGEPTGEASATFSNASAAEAAIRRFDGSRFDEGIMRVSVAKRAAQGSLTKRGRGRGAGGRITFAERQLDLIASQRERQALDEKDAFAAARLAAAEAKARVSGVSATAATVPTAAAAAAAAAATTASAAAAKKRKASAMLPGVVVVKAAANGPSAASAPPTAVAAPSAAAAMPGATAPMVAAGCASLLGLADYGSDDDSDGDDAS